MINCTITCTIDGHLLLSSVPLLKAGKIDAIEWMFDTSYMIGGLPDRYEALIHEYSNQGRLLGHGVFFSLFSGKRTDDHTQRIKDLKLLSHTFNFSHITEHFGYMTGKDFHSGAPMSVPKNRDTIQLGQDRLKRISQAAQCPVGLENLAFAFCLEDVKQQGNFLYDLLNPINGFIILDIHNIYCQAHNFGLNAEDIISLYPLELVREIHISGGSWQESIVGESTQKVRRDTHDESVPKEVFDLLEKTLPRCNNVQYVTLEQLGNSLVDQKSKDQFVSDFEYMKKIISSYEKKNLAVVINDFVPSSYSYKLGEPLQNNEIYYQQLALSNILENAKDVSHAKELLSKTNLKKNGRDVDSWLPHMIDTGMDIAKKWK